MLRTENYNLTEKKYIIDANINRFKEGARVLEDIARFILNDYQLFTQIRELRHNVKLPFISRAAQKDIGGISFIEDNDRISLIDLAHANSIRMQEASRVLEEVFCSSFKTIRYKSYQIHDRIINSIKRFTHFYLFKGIYVICDIDNLKIDQIIRVINNSNISLCQIRSKNKDKQNILKIVNVLRKKIKTSVAIIINDHLDIALSSADGVHLGQSDFPLSAAKRICPENFIIGISCHNLEQAKDAASNGANYISVGCIFDTKTKKDTIPVTLATLEEITKKIQLPIGVIGGINYKNSLQLLNYDIDMIAVCSAIWEAEDPNQAIKQLNTYSLYKCTCRSLLHLIMIITLNLVANFLIL